ncbi:hypothetical protein DFH29DRAFT_1077890 [Suillus ampliporus]|nr:hypothetical protein DFH29DRAFT_1077890 [Suillus ampliporus]
MISTAVTVTARITVTGYLTVSLFRQTVVDHTAQAPSKAENVSACLIAYSVCSSTIMLLLASDAAAQRFLSNDVKHTPALKGDAADTNSPVANDNTTPATLKSVCLPMPSPSSSHYARPCITLASPNLYCKCLSIDSNTTTLVPYGDDLVTDDFSGDASDTNDCELLGGDSTFHEDGFSKGHSRKQHDSEQTTLDTLLAKMKAVTLHDPPPPRPSKLRPLLLVNNRQKPSTSPYPPLPEPAYPMDALTRSMEALSLSDSLSPTSKLNPLILVKKRAIGQLELLPPTTLQFDSLLSNRNTACDITAFSYDLEFYRPRG